MQLTLNRFMGVAHSSELAHWKGNRKTFTRIDRSLTLQKKYNILVITQFVVAQFIFSSYILQLVFLTSKVKLLSSVLVLLVSLWYTNCLVNLSFFWSINFFLAYQILFWSGKFFFGRPRKYLVCQNFFLVYQKNEKLKGQMVHQKDLPKVHGHAWCTLLKRIGPPSSRKFTEVHLVIVRYFRILKIILY